MPRNINPKANQFTDPRPLVESPFPQDGKGQNSKQARSMTVNLAESPLNWLHARGHVSDRQMLAGEKLREDFEAASLGPQITMRWDGYSGGRQKRSSHEPMAQSERMVMAKKRFDNALDALGKDVADIAWRVICSGEALSGAEKNLGWPQRSGKLVLKIALDRLADYYRIN